MSLENYPHLAKIQDDLTALSIAETARQPAEAARVEQARSYKGQELRVVPLGAWGSWALDRPQRLVVKELIEAYGSASPDVDQGYLLRASRGSARHLRDVFRGSPAWGSLIVPGRTAGAYRMRTVGPKAG